MIPALVAAFIAITLLVGSFAWSVIDQITELEAFLDDGWEDDADGW